MQIPQRAIEPLFCIRNKIKKLLIPSYEWVRIFWKDGSAIERDVYRDALNRAALAFVMLANVETKNIVEKMLFPLPSYLKGLECQLLFLWHLQNDLDFTYMKQLELMDQVVDWFNINLGFRYVDHLQKTIDINYGGVEMQLKIYPTGKFLNNRY